MSDVTPHPIDTEALRDRMRRAVATAEEDGSGAYIDPRDLTALLDAIQYGTEHRKFLIGRLRGAKHRADNHEARAKAAEHRATRAEKWAALWKETTRHQLGHIADRDDAHASCHWNSLVQADEVSAWQERAEQAETRIKAVEDVLEESEARGPVGMTFNGTPFPAWISIATVRRALTA